MRTQNDNTSKLQKVKINAQNIKKLSNELGNYLNAIRAQIQDNINKQEKLIEKHEEISSVISIKEIEDNLTSMLDQSCTMYLKDKNTSFKKLTSADWPQDAQKMRDDFNLISTNRPNNSNVGFIIFMLKPYFMENISNIATSIAPDNIIDLNEKNKLLAAIDKEIESLQQEESELRCLLNENNISIDSEYIVHENPLLTKEIQSLEQEFATIKPFSKKDNVSH
ncbi:MAG: hypothetical protein QM504_15370 [Pseudomonadota bacterium]